MIEELQRVSALATAIDHTADLEADERRFALHTTRLILQREESYRRTVQGVRDALRQDVARLTQERDELQAALHSARQLLTDAVLEREEAFRRTVQGVRDALRQDVARLTQERDELREALHSARQLLTDAADEREEERCTLQAEIKRITQENQQLARALHDRRGRIRRERGGHR